MEKRHFEQTRLAVLWEEIVTSPGVVVTKIVGCTLVIILCIRATTGLQHVDAERLVYGVWLREQLLHVHAAAGTVTAAILRWEQRQKAVQTDTTEAGLDEERLAAPLDSFGTR